MGIKRPLLKSNDGDQRNVVGAEVAKFIRGLGYEPSTVKSITIQAASGENGWASHEVEVVRFVTAVEGQTDASLDEDEKGLRRPRFRWDGAPTVTFRHPFVITGGDLIEGGPIAVNLSPAEGALLEAINSMPTGRSNTSRRAAPREI